MSGMLNKMPALVVKRLSPTEHQRFTHAYFRLWTLTYLPRNVLVTTLRMNKNLQELVQLLDLSYSWTLQHLAAGTRLTSLGVSLEQWRMVCDALNQDIEDKQTTLWSRDATYQIKLPRTLALLGMTDGGQYLLDPYPKSMPPVDLLSEEEEEDYELVKRNGRWVNFSSCSDLVHRR